MGETILYRNELLKQRPRARRRETTMNNSGIQVQMFGEFQLSCGGTVVCGREYRSHKVKSLLAYLIYHHNRMVPIDELTGILDASKKNAAPVAALRTTLYRMRCAVRTAEDMLGLPLIVTRNGMYGWNPEAALELDTEEFEAACRAGIPDGPEQMEHCRRMLGLYQGDFLDKLASEHWVEPLAEHYRSLYLSAVEQVAPVLIEAGDPRTAAEHCAKAMVLSPYSESVCRWLMRAYAASGNTEAAAAAYEQMRSVLYKDLGVVPEEETKKVYQSVLCAGEESVLSPDSIRSKLQEDHPAAGALICDFTSFRLFYQAEARSAARRGDAVHIGILSVSSRTSTPLSARSLAHTMEKLHDLISEELRTGDIASSCSASQYILMLVQANYENSRMVCDRIVKSFFRTHPRSPARINTAVFPLEPTFPERMRE